MRCQTHIGIGRYETRSKRVLLIFTRKYRVLVGFDCANCEAVI